MHTPSHTSTGENSVAASNYPPQWMQSLLTHILKARDRESIPGDLLEEYQEERLPRLGRARADLWYIRQILSLAFFQAFKGGPMKRSLICLCFLTLAASVCFGVMEIFLRQKTVLYHPGSDVRIIWAIMLATASIITILYLVLPGYRLLRILLSLGAVAMLSFGISAILVVIRSIHFEVYFLLYGVALILQLTLAILALAFVPDEPYSHAHL
jgi:hypothetical protein